MLVDNIHFADKLSIFLLTLHFETGDARLMENNNLY